MKFKNLKANFYAQLLKPPLVFGFLGLGQQDPSSYYYVVLVLCPCLNS